MRNLQIKNKNMNLQVSDLEGKTFEEKLLLWAEEVVAYCDKIARTKVDCGEFYAFQSMPQEEPNVLFLALNPHDSYRCTTYQVQRENKNWNIPNGMTEDVFIKANPCYNGKDTWTILKGFEKTKNVHPELKSIFDSMMYMNLLYFSSIDFKDFRKKFNENWKEVLDKCAEFSNFLIYEIIKPKKIVCLGANCFPKFIGKEKFSILNGIVKKTIVNKIPVYGIPHPSSPYLSDIERVMTGWTLANDWFGVEIPQEIKIIKPSKLNPHETIKILKGKEFLKEKSVLNDEKTLRFSIGSPKGIHFELVVTATGKGYVAIRKLFERTNDNDPVYIKILSEQGFSENEHWLGVKFFKDYFAENEDELAEKIKEDIVALIDNSSLTH